MRRDVRIATCVAAGAFMRPAQAIAIGWLVLWVASFAVGARLGDPASSVGADRIAGLRILDSDGELLREPLGAQGDRSRWVVLDEISPSMKDAVLAAEDRRFASHPGVDPLSVARAAAQNLAAGHVVAGGSTVTQQLVKLTTGKIHRRTFGVKLEEMAAALHFERHLGKDEILEAYLNWVPFGHLTRGVQMASWTYFRKPSAHLTLSEASALAALVRGPGAMDPYAHPDRLDARRRWVLGRMREIGSITDEAYGHALHTPTVFLEAAPVFEAPHLAEEILRRTQADGLAAGEVVTTIDSRMQRRTESLVRSVLHGLGELDVSNAAVVIIHNPTAEVRAWVGSGGYFDTETLGMNDGVMALRSPGSTLKPILYAQALERGYMTSTMLADVPVAFYTPDGPYRPRNYDGQFRGPVLMRQALGSSLNVPAVAVAADLGPQTVLGALHRAGFESLDREPSYYGAAIALGDGEVSLLELAAAYSALARGGMWQEPVLVKRVLDASGADVPLSDARQRRVFDEGTAYLVTSMLADPAARAPTFGQAHVFDLGFALAVKTGTSHDYRDNWTVGYTPEYTVAVWVGNFDGKPMGNVSGITGAGPLFGRVMRAVTPVGTVVRFVAPPGIVTHRVCALSGDLPGPACDVTYEEVFVKGHEPRSECTVHRLVEVDSRTGLLAGESCPADMVTTARFESYPDVLLQWAKEANRPLLPGPGPLCGPMQGDAPSHGSPSILDPSDGALFVLNPDVPPDEQAISVLLDPGGGKGPVTLLVDGQPAGAATHPPWKVNWTMAQGEHVLAASVQGKKGLSVTVTVD